VTLGDSGTIQICWPIIIRQWLTVSHADESRESMHRHPHLGCAQVRVPVSAAD